MRSVLSAMAIAAVAIAPACDCGSDEDRRVARLDRAGGRTERAEGDGPWKPADPGQWFSIGDGARTGPDGEARLELSRGGGLRMAPSTVIRFGRGAAPDVPRIDLEVGQSVIEAGDASARVELEVGMARITPGSRVQLRAGEDGLRFEVLVGSSQIERPDGEDVELSAGEGLEIEIGSAVVERVEVPADAGADDAAAPADAAIEVPSGEIRAEVRGRGVKSRSEGGEWERLPPGEHPLSEQTTVRLGRGDSIAVERDDQKATVTGPGQAVIAPPGGALVATRRGSTDVQATTTDVRVEVPGGVVVARRAPGDGSRGTVEVPRSGSTRVRARRGRVAVIGERGGRETIEIGEAVSVRRDGAIDVTERAPELVDLILSAGDSAAVHAPRPPVALRFRFADQCPGEGVVELAEGRSFARKRRLSKGREGANILAGRGAHAYRVRCLEDGVLSDEPAARGLVRVHRDRGTRPLARKAPHNLIDADGRRYTVLYQNKLPSITFRWQTAAEGPYRLHVKRGDRERTWELQEPKRTVGSGVFSEGTYRYWFTADDVRSKTSTLRIDFDNAAPRAYISRPRVGASWEGDSLRVSGAALEGWSVSVSGVPLPLDRQHRFSARVERPRDTRALAVRFSHPRRGTHYFLRRDRDN